MRNILSICDNCGRKINKKRNALDRYKKHFCDKDCYNEYKRKNKYYPKKVAKKDMKYQTKIKRLAKLRVRKNATTKGN